MTLIVCWLFTTVYWLITATEVTSVCPAAALRCFDEHWEFSWYFSCWLVYSRGSQLVVCKQPIYNSINELLLVVSTYAELSRLHVIAVLDMSPIMNYAYWIGSMTVLAVWQSWRWANSRRRYHRLIWLRYSQLLDSIPPNKVCGKESPWLRNNSTGFHLQLLVRLRITTLHYSIFRRFTATYTQPHGSDHCDGGHIPITRIHLHLPSLSISCPDTLSVCPAGHLSRNQISNRKTGSWLTVNVSHEDLTLRTP